MNASETIRDAFYLINCQLLMLWRSLILKPKVVTISGVVINVNKDILSRKMVRTIYRGYYEREEQSIIKKTIDPEDVILELGGGIGFISSYASKKLNGTGKVTVIEANPDLIPYIKATHKKNNVNAEVINCVISDQSDEMAFYIADNFWASSLEEIEGRRKVYVSTKTFDDAIHESNANYLIIDIEGGEYSLFIENDFTIPDKINKICIELHPDVIGDDSTSKIISAILMQGFSLRLNLMKSMTVAYFSR